MGLRSLRILVAEDNPVNQLVAVRLLEKLGHESTVVENGELALQAFERGGFDLLLVDVQMPVMSGFEATAAIRAREATRGGHLPIVGLTAHATKDDRERCLEAGMDVCLSKPIKAADLSAALERFAAAGADSPGAGSDPDAPGVFDRDQALENMAGDENLLFEIIQLWLEDTPQRLVEIREGVAASDTWVIERAAHRLRGSVSTLGATLATEAAQRVERLAAAGDRSSLAEAAAALEAEIARLRCRLDRLAERREAA